MSRSKLEQKAIAFSAQLSDFMGIPYDAILEAHVDIDFTSFKVGKWQVVPQLRYLGDNDSGGWHNLLEVIPYNTPLSYGHCNPHNGTIPSNWHFIPDGTRTLVLPPKEVRDEILLYISEVRNKKSR
jgi:hypothetical protein